MCSISIMPADYEMLISHSPPVFSHSPPSGFLSAYSPYRIQYDNPYSRIQTQNHRNYHQRQVPTSLHIHADSLDGPNNHNHNNNHNPKDNNRNINMPQSPRRPCLVSRGTENLENLEEDPLSPTRLKKKVVFADDRGMSLTHVRFMTEPSSVPPVWSTRFLAQVTKGLCAEVTPEPWEVTFPQPASDYVDFRRKLDQENVSLENVIVKESEECVLGTIKVKNLSFEKEVFVRSTSDDWKTKEDIFCKFVNNNNQLTPISGHYTLYDTFSFKITLPPKSKKIEFCVCYKIGEQEFWDNNQSKNYILLKKTHDTLSKSHSVDDFLNQKPKLHRSNSDTETLFNCLKISDVYQAKLESWSEFASWNHLENNTPYW